MPVELDSQELQLLLRQFDKGNVVLFAGAGFSLGATNRQGTEPPLSQRLCELLAARCGWQYGGEELPVVYDQAQKHLGTEGLTATLSEWYEGCSPASWHLLVPRFYWYRIYTTNIDDVIENSYKSGSSQRLTPIVCPAPYQDQDVWYERVQCVHLHGSVLDFGKGLTFSFEDFAGQTATPNPWYQALAEDMFSKSFLFIGTRLSESPFYHYLSMRTQRPRGAKEFRARAFLVTPQMTQIRKRQMEDQGFVVVEATSEEFSQTLYQAVSSRLPTRIDLLKNRYPHQIQALASGILERQAELLRQFELVSPAEQPSDRDSFPSHFLEGAEPTWEDITNNRDAERTITNAWFKLFAAPTHGLRSFIIVGHAGSGKSTIMRRGALELARQGFTVYFSKSPHKLEKSPILNFLDSLGDRHVFIFVDDAMVHLESVREIAQELPHQVNVTFVLADRPHIIYPKLPILAALSPRVLDMPYLDRQDSEHIIDKLNEVGLLGALKGKKQHDQIREFLVRSKKQLLVAMKEATSGKGFDVILLNEFNSLSGQTARLAYVVACLAYMHGAPVRKRHLFACMDGTDLQKATVLGNDLREILIPWRGNQEYVSPRHRVIANQVATETAPPELKSEALLSYLIQISGDINPQNIRMRTPEYVGYRGLVNFDSMLDLFGPDYQVIGGVYEDLKGYYSEDFLFWLQFGRAEVYFEHFELAENYLNQSLGIREIGNFQAHHYMGVLFLTRALFQDNLAAATADVAHGEEVLRKQIAQRGSTDAYPYAALIKHKLRYIKKWEPPRKGEQLEELYRLSQTALQRHALDPAMKEAGEEITREYLMQAVRQTITVPAAPDGAPAEIGADRTGEPSD